MCGLCGLWSSGKAFRLQDVVKCIGAGINHRGQDGYGAYVGHSEYFTLDKVIRAEGTEEVSFALDEKEASGDVWIGNSRYGTVGQTVGSNKNKTAFDNSPPQVYIGRENVTDVGALSNNALVVFLNGEFSTADDREILTNNNNPDKFDIKATNDTTIIAAYAQNLILKGKDLMEAAVETLKHFSGSYLIVFSLGDEYVVARDSFATRNGCLYLSDHLNHICVSSESQSFKKIDRFYSSKQMKAHPYSPGFRDLFPGEVMRIKKKDDKWTIVESTRIKKSDLEWPEQKLREVDLGSYNVDLEIAEQIPYFTPDCDCLDDIVKLMINEAQVNGEVLIDDGPLETRMCSFEKIYYESPKCKAPISSIRVRARDGRNLSPLPGVMTIGGLEHLINKDNVVVVPVPDSGRSAANGYAHHHGYKLKEGFIKEVKVRYFISSEGHRELVIQEKYDVIPDVFKGKHVIIVDDSVVRGTTMAQLILLALEEGAFSVNIKSSAPIIRYPCFSGVDVKKKTDFIAVDDDGNQRSIDEIKEEALRLCCETVRHYYEMGVYQERDLKMMFEKLFCEGIFNLEYVSLEDFKNSLNSFFVNQKRRWCLACFDGDLHVKSGDQRLAFDT